MKKLLISFIVLLPLTILAQSPRNPNNKNYIGKDVTKKDNPPASVIASGDLDFSTTVKMVRGLAEKSQGIINVTKEQAKSVVHDSQSNKREELGRHIDAAVSVVNNNEYSKEDSTKFQTLMADFKSNPQSAEIIASVAVPAETPQPDSVSISIIGVAGASSVDGLKQNSAAVSVGISFAWGKHYNRNTGWYHLYQRNSFYMLFNPASAVSNDSLSVAKTYLFPEISKRDFVLGYERVFPFALRNRLDHTNNEARPTTFSFFSEFSTSHYDTGNSAFRNYNVTTGFKVTYRNENAGLGFGIQIIPYYSFIGSERKDWNNRNQSILGLNSTALDTLQHKGIPPTVHAFGVNCKGSISSFEVFANFKYILNADINLNKTIEMANPSFQTTLLTIGVVINPDIWSFNKHVGAQNLAKNEKRHKRKNK